MADLLQLGECSNARAVSCQFQAGPGRSECGVVLLMVVYIMIQSCCPELLDEGRRP